MNFTQTSIPYENIGKRVATTRGYNYDFFIVTIICFVGGLIGLSLLFFSNDENVEPILVMLPVLAFFIFLILFLRSKKCEKHLELIGIGDAGLDILPE